jgi:hypothetical protein
VPDDGGYQAHGRLSQSSGTVSRFKPISHRFILWDLFVAQCSKEVLLADEASRLDPAQALLVSIDLPVAARGSIHRRAARALRLASR